MSGGGSSKKKTDTKEEPTTPAQATYQQSAFMPGMDNMLAQQLAAGGYGDPSSLLAAFGQIFTPMSVPDYRPGATPAPVTPAPTTPTTPSTSPQPGRGRSGRTTPNYSYNGGRDG